MMFFVLAATASATKPSAFLHLAPEKVAFKEAANRAENPEKVAFKEATNGAKNQQARRKLAQSMGDSGEKLRQQATAQLAEAAKQRVEANTLRRDADNRMREAIQDGKMAEDACNAAAQEEDGIADKAEEEARTLSLEGDHDKSAQKSQDAQQARQQARDFRQEGKQFVDDAAKNGQESADASNGLASAIEDNANIITHQSQMTGWKAEHLKQQAQSLWLRLGDEEHH